MHSFTLTTDKTDKTDNISFTTELKKTNEPKRNLVVSISYFFFLYGPIPINLQKVWVSALE